ncbi:homoserine O-acetyltransferase [Thelephora ganbajun]|uniref:Homoserine O-acetyltransferase n=1 Tax=Thelephora ganbajun TaxID=370292 RepID=A0ACB6Z1U5_THEGA|nr:homoserine O-acetyltransferase [Thelephora ganbajun]
MSPLVEIDQEILVLPSFTLECGETLRDVPVAYKTWGKLNEQRDNVMIICHAFTGSSDVEDWWGPLMGSGKAFDPNRFFIFCANVTGSPYGTISPVSVNPDAGEPYGPSFPPTSIRDDIFLHKCVLDHLGVASVAVVIGGSMGGMAVLEWPLCTPPGFVRHIIPIATSAHHSAWCISWGETQRQCIYSDPEYEDGYYEVQPASGLAAARMVALLTYRSRDSFESRFGRKVQVERKKFNGRGGEKANNPTNSATTAATDGNTTTSTLANMGNGDPRAHHNDGNRSGGNRTSATSENSRPPIFSAQSYLRYQGDKFVARFDANCYVHLTRKLDTHDIARGRRRTDSGPSQKDGDQTQKTEEALAEVLRTLPPRALVIGIETDGLFTPSEQRLIASHVPDAELVIVPSPEGHDGFLLEFELINGHILKFLKKEFPEFYLHGEGVDVEPEPTEGFEVKKASMFGEAEVDITHW